MTITTIDPQGRCAVHPFVQLKLQSKRTGVWKALLESCPLCDNRVPTRARFEEKKEELPSAEAYPLPLKQRAGQEKSRKKQASDKKDGADKINNGLRRTRSSQNFQGRARSCSNERAPSVKSQRSLPKDASLDSYQSHQSSRSRPQDTSPESRRSYRSSRSRPKDAILESRRSYQSSMLRPKDASLESRRSYQSSSPRPKNPSMEIRKSCQSSRPRPKDANLESRRSYQSSKSRPKDASLDSRRSYQLTRPRPKDGSLESRRSYQSTRPRPKDASLDRRQTYPPIKPHLKDASLNYRRSRSNSVSSRLYRQITARPGYEDEVSTLSTLARGNIIGSGGSRPGYKDEVSTQSHILQGTPSSSLVVIPFPSKTEDGNGADAKGAEVGSSRQIATSAYETNFKIKLCRYDGSPLPTNHTADFDSKGRCVRHPHVRLRKKKLLGGWKVLMTACPDCCVDELRRMRVVEEKNETNEGEEKAERGRPSGRSISLHSPDANHRSKLSRGSGGRSYDTCPGRRARQRKDGEDRQERGRSGSRGTSLHLPRGSGGSRGGPGGSGGRHLRRSLSSDNANERAESGCSTSQGTGLHFPRGSGGSRRGAGGSGDSHLRRSLSSDNAPSLRSPSLDITLKKPYSPGPSTDTSDRTSPLTESTSGSLVTSAANSVGADPTWDTQKRKEDPKEHPQQARHRSPCGRHSKASVGGGSSWNWSTCAPRVGRPACPCVGWVDGTAEGPRGHAPGVGASGVRHGGWRPCSRQQVWPQ